MLNLNVGSVFLYQNSVKNGIELIKSSRSVGIICNHENGILLRDKFPYSVYIDTTGHGDYVLIDVCALIHSDLVPQYIIYDTSTKYTLSIKDKYNCKK